MSVGETVAILNERTSRVDGNMHYQTETGELGFLQVSSIHDAQIMRRNSCSVVCNQNKHRY